MNNLNINTGVKRITINGDPERVIEFNPADVTFAERFYQLIGDFEKKQAEYQARSEKLDADTDLDEHGIPANVGDKLKFSREVCEYMYSQIDFLFGVGTSKKVFGDALVMDGIIQFFEGILPFLQSARSEKIGKYAPKGKRAMK